MPKLISTCCMVLQYKFFYFLLMVYLRNLKMSILVPILVKYFLLKYKILVMPATDPFSILSPPDHDALFLHWIFVGIPGKQEELFVFISTLLIRVRHPLTPPEAPMHTPIILAAFGTTTQALATYHMIGQQIRERFTGHQVSWAFSSKVINRRLGEDGKGMYNSPLEEVQIIKEQGYDRAVIQSLHLLPGREFHQLVRDCRQAAIPCYPGLPLLASPQDYRAVTDCLAPLILARPDRAILLIGHGTNHPIWIAYLALENFFRRAFGNRIFVGVVEKNPDSEKVPEEIAAAGFSQVCMIPLLLVAGMHYARDVMGAGKDSWLSRLQWQGLEVENIGIGLGLQPGFCGIIIEHIEQALLQADILETPPKSDS